MPIVTVTTGSRERLLNEYFRQWVSYKTGEFFFARTERKKKSRGEILLRGCQLHC